MSRLGFTPVGRRPDLRDPGGVDFPGAPNGSEGAPGADDGATGHNGWVPSLDFAERLDGLAPGVYSDGLRPAQAHVLDRFAESHTGTSDVGIELPTGEGKTLIGLLIADWALDEGMSVAVEHMSSTRVRATRSLRRPVVHRAFPSWIRTVGPRTVTHTLSATQAERYRPWFENTRRLRELVSELQALSVQVVDDTEGWEASTAAGPAS